MKKRLTVFYSDQFHITDKRLIRNSSGLTVVAICLVNNWLNDMYCIKTETSDMINSQIQLDIDVPNLSQKIIERSTN